ncbi:hypothetical protein KEM55_005890 [Ascosphaera atra]|nr:hypothetical protein KEM55_005890 [Ascosphaera atra]
MSDGSDADKIRAKRLAKLSAASNASSQSQPENGDAQSSSQAQSSAAPPEPSHKAEESAPAQPSARPQAEPKRIRITPQSSQRGSRAASPASTTKTSSSKPPESLESYEDRTLRTAFRVTLDESKKADAQGNQLLYLAGLKRELEADGSPLLVRTSNLETLLLEAASHSPGRPLNYLIPSWKRITAVARNVKKTPENEPKIQVLSEAQRLCLSYCIFGITMPEMFGSPEAEPAKILKEHLMLDFNDEMSLDTEFLHASISRADEDDTILSTYVEAIELVSESTSRMSLDHDSAAITEARSFIIPSLPPKMIEWETLLGPFFRLSPMEGEQPVQYFSMAKSLSNEHIEAGKASMRMLFQTHAGDLFDIVNHLLRASKPARERVLDWFADAINKNHKRRAMMVEPTAIDKIDPDYLRRNPRVLIQDETKLFADQKTADEFYATKVEGTSPFISEVFFLTVAAQHYGSFAINHELKQFRRQMHGLNQDIEEFERDINADPDPYRKMRDEIQLKRLKTIYDRGMARIYSSEGILRDEIWQTRVVQFMRYLIVWLLRIVSGKKYPQEPIELPLPAEKNMLFSCLPEYFVEDVCDGLGFIMSEMSTVMTATQAEEVVTMALTFLECSDYIKNPHLKAGLVTILCNGCYGHYVGQEGAFVPLFNSMPFCNKYLLHALMKFYIEAEFTGTSSQFYDKFNIRFEIFQVIKAIWPNTWYQDKLEAESKDNQEFFVKFVNLLMNDVTYVLDESFSAFVEINTVTRELEDPTMNTEARREKIKTLQSAKRKAKSYMQLTNETVLMLGRFTKPLADAFSMPEIVQRFADMLDYNLSVMVGPRSSELRVENPAEYGWRPRELLSGLVDVYLNLMEKDDFLLAVARDGRSYKPENFAKAGAIVRKWAMRGQDELARWELFQQKVKEKKELDEQLGEDLGEAPDEFLDPLMYTLMEDPVILPRSRVSIDRATIRSHLLSDPNDPFNRMPLTMEDVIPDTELKAKIEAWKAERRAAARANRMDTSD